MTHGAGVVAGKKNYRRRPGLFDLCHRAASQGMCVLYLKKWSRTVHGAGASGVPQTHSTS